MATTDATCTWTDPDPQSKVCAKRDNESFASWAAAAVSLVLDGGSSTQPASGSGEPLTHTIVWTKSGREYTYVVRSWGGQSDLDDAVDAIKDAIVAAGGTVVSG